MRVYDRKGLYIMQNKIIITSDSTTDLGKKLIARYGIKILPLKVALGEKTYTDGVDITPDMIYEHYRAAGELPQTAAPNLAECMDFFGALVKDGYAVVHFTISSEMSSSCSNAAIAAQEFEGVHVVDTRNLSTGGGLLVLTACEMAQQGMEAAEIAAKCREMTDRVSASFVVDDLTFLHKGGRCSALAALGANLLKLKPCIEVIGGKMDVSRKYRGKFEKVLPQYIADQIGDGSKIETDHVFVTHAGCDEEIYQMCVEEVRKLVDVKEIHITRAGCTISSHCGRNTLGVLFIRK